MRESTTNLLEKVKKISLSFLVLLMVDWGSIHAQSLANAGLLTGMNINTTVDRKPLVEQLKEAHVEIVRCSLNNASDASLDFAKSLYDDGIKVDALVGYGYPAGTPVRPEGLLRSARPLSWADPELSRQQYQALIDKVEAKGLVLASLELDNEFNWADFNGDFPVPGEGKIFELKDLSTDPEAKKVAEGFLQYLKCLSALKDVRDHSKLNRNTPIILGGLVDVDANSSWPKPSSKMDVVSTNATLSFLRAHGVNQLVDFYGIHIYPKETTAEERRKDISRSVGENRGSAANKPFYITEWGIDNNDPHCPPDDQARLAIVKDVMADFRQLAKQGHLVGALYFCWNYGTPQHPGSSVFRCGQLLESGKQALLP